MSILASTIHNLVPVQVQGELAPASSQVVQALICAVMKFGKDGVLSISQYEAIKLLQGTESVELAFDFETNAMLVKVRRA